LRKQKIDGRARNLKRAAFAGWIPDWAALEKPGREPRNDRRFTASQARIQQLTEVVQKG
jgi:hypothetical protein